ncbi:hypothetical protein BVX97_04540, partial [bacterium E08(2017)]
MNSRLDITKPSYGWFKSLMLLVAFIGTIAVEAVAQDAEAPDTPTNLRATEITPSTYMFEWDESYDNVGVVKYLLKQSVISQSNPDHIGETTGAIMTYSGDDAPALALITNKVAAVDGAGNISIWSEELVNVLGDNESPNTPANVNITPALFFDSCLVSWTPSADNVSVDHYVIRRTWGANVAYWENDDTSFSQVNLPQGVLVRYEVAAVDASNNTSAWSTVVSM